MALSISGTNLSANATSRENTAVATVRILWDGVTPTNETAQLINLSISRSVSDPGRGAATPGAGTMSSCTLVLDNSGRRYSPSHSAGPLYADIQNTVGVGAEVRIDLGYNDAANGDETLRRFTGFINTVSLAGPGSPFVTYSCRGREQRTVENRHRTTLKTDQFVDDVFADLMADVGISAGQYNFDIGFHRVSYVWLENEDVFRQMQGLAEADAGFCYVDQAGVVQFENAWHWLTDSDHNSSVISFDLDESMYQGVSVSHQQQDIYNSVLVDWTPRRPGSSASLFKATRPWQVEPGETVTFRATFRQAAVVVDPLIAGEHYTVVSPGGVDMASSVTISTTIYAQSIDVQVTNNHANYIAEFRQFEITGVPLAGLHAEPVVIDASDSAIGDPASDLVKRLEIRDNVFIQTQVQAEVLAWMTLDRSKNPRRAATLSGVPAVPWLEIGDRVTVDSTNQAWTAVPFFVTGISETYQANPRQYEQNLSLLDAASFYQYSLNEYFITGTDVPHATTSKRLFY